jgi:hypothetical protein
MRDKIDHRRVEVNAVFLYRYVENSGAEIFQHRAKENFCFGLKLLPLLYRKSAGLDILRSL